jgi:hypothetical protein
VWGDFYGVRAVGNSRPVPFLDAFPLTLWAHVGPPSAPDIRALAHVSNLVSLQLNHYQFLFLLRIADDLTEVRHLFWWGQSSKSNFYCCKNIKPLWYKF